MSSYEIKKILSVTIFYPSPATPTKFVFVKNIMESLARQGRCCVVVQPISFFQSLNRKGYPFSEKTTVENGGSIEVFRPYYWAFPIIAWGTKLKIFNPNKLKFSLFTHSVLKLIKKIHFLPDVVYGHFLYFAGGCAVNVGKKLNIPSFVGVGESGFWSCEPLGMRYARKQLHDASGFFPNSTCLGKMLNEELNIAYDSMCILPNGVALDCFTPQNRMKMRSKYGLPQQSFIVGFVGHYSHRKGTLRLCHAIDGLAGVGGVFLGSGSDVPIGENVLLSQQVSNDQIPEILSACDVFVLPTLSEGCCNAIIEAMACGLPIISSVGAFNDDIINQDCSIRVDPLDTEAIRKAIIRLRDDPALRQGMADAAFRQAQYFDINVRAKRMLEFMSRMVSGGHRIYLNRPKVDNGSGIVIC